VRRRLKPALQAKARATLVALLLIVSTSCVDPCGNEVISAQPSPDGRVKAVVFVRGCGATVRDFTGVSVVKANAGVPTGWATALTISDDPAHPIERSTPEIEVRLRWETDRRLSVFFPRDALVRKRGASLGGIEIVYGTF